jgi:hypothetical protein
VLAVLWGGGSVLGDAEGAEPGPRDATGKVVRKGLVGVTSLAVGECVETWVVTSTARKVTVLPCSMRHDAEIIHTFTATGGDTYPGDGAISAQAGAQCLAAARTAVTPGDLAKASIAYLAPLGASWKSQRRIACVAVMPAPLSRSVRP